MSFEEQHLALRGINKLSRKKVIDSEFPQYSIPVGLIIFHIHNFIYKVIWSEMQLQQH